METTFGGDEELLGDYGTYPVSVSNKELSRKVLLARTFVMMASSPKIFFGSFFWEAFAYLSYGRLKIGGGFGRDAFVYFFLTGLGSALGVFIGQLIIIRILGFMGDNRVRETQKGLLLATASFFTGSLWGVTVDFCSEFNFNFTLSMILVGIFSGIIFFMGLRIFRSVYKYYFDINYDSRRSLEIDAWLSLSIIGAEGFFVGTCAQDVFSGNWLYILFGIEDTTFPLVAFLKSGCSSLLGFYIFQTVQNLSVKYSWVDHDED